MSTISRRSFVTRLAATGAAAGALGIAGTAFATEATESADEQASWEDQVSATEEADIVVAGSGTAGTFAAVRAAELGAKVVWLEKTGIPGGTSSVTESSVLPNSQAQLASGSEADAAAVFKLLMDWHNWGAKPSAVQSFLDNAGAAADWAVSHDGVAFTHMGDGGFTCIDENGAWENMGTGLLTPLREGAQKLDNLDFRTETPVVGLVVDDAKVTGVYTRDAAGTVTRIDAKAVILATGGFGTNPEMCEKYLRLPADRIEFLGMPGQDGDGINMGIAAGGSLHAMTSVMFGLTTIEGSAWDSMETIFLLWPPSWREPQEKGGSLPLVNQKGERFYNEARVDEAVSSKLNTAVALQPQTWVLFDEKHLETYAGIDEFDYMSGIAHGNLREAVETSDAFVTADTIEELAGLMGVDAEALAATINAWNARIDGTDTTPDPFGADPTMLEKVVEAPFHAGKFHACAYSTCGGLSTDYNNQVVDADEQPIEGLYATGIDNGSMYFNDYPYGVYSGTGQGTAACTGFVAANAAWAKING